MNNSLIQETYFLQIRQKTKNKILPLQSQSYSLERSDESPTTGMNMKWTNRTYVTVEKPVTLKFSLSIVIVLLLLHLRLNSYLYVAASLLHPSDCKTTGDVCGRHHRQMLHDLSSQYKMIIIVTHYIWHFKFWFSTKTFLYLDQEKMHLYSINRFSPFSLQIFFSFYQKLYTGYIFADTNMEVDYLGLSS